MFTHSPVGKRLVTYYFLSLLIKIWIKWVWCLVPHLGARWGLCFHLSPVLICVFFSVFEILFASVAASENLMIHFWLAQFSEVFYPCTFINFLEHLLCSLWFYLICFYLCSILEILCQFIQFIQSCYSMSSEKNSSTVFSLRAYDLSIHRIVALLITPDIDTNLEQVGLKFNQNVVGYSH